jgi:hypothetical protein
MTLAVIHLNPDIAERVANGAQTVLTFPPDMANVPAAGSFVHALGIVTGQRVGIARPGALIASAVVEAVVPIHVYSDGNRCPYRYTLHICVTNRGQAGLMDGERFVRDLSDQPDFTPGWSAVLLTDVARIEARCPAC